MTDLLRDCPHCGKALVPITVTSLHPTECRGDCALTVEVARLREALEYVRHRLEYIGSARKGAYLHEVHRAVSKALEPAPSAAASPAEEETPDGE